MPLEIERRFLVTGDAWKAHVVWIAELRQGYLQSREDGLTTRIRLQQAESGGEQEAWLTIKAVPDGASLATRLEFEYRIPVADAEALLALSCWRLEKRRHGLLLPGGEWVLDVFRGANAPLLIAEVELLHADQEIEIPSWCGQEITGLHQLSNASLARQPWQTWDASETRLFHGP
jgi:CYTH domain-containing protein